MALTKLEAIQQVLDNNFSKEGFTLEGILPYIPKRLDHYGNVFGWDSSDYQVRVFLAIGDVKGFKQHLQNTKDKLKEVHNHG